LKYRITNHSDTKGIAKLLVDTWNTTYSNILSGKVLQKRTYKYVEEKWRPRIKALTKKDMMVIAETEQENIVGITRARTEKLNPTKSLFEATRFEGELMAIYVLKDYQGKRIGTNLVHYS
jgi:GNAT superfamily N-acetyltransferase